MARGSAPRASVAQTVASSGYPARRLGVALRARSTGSRHPLSTPAPQAPAAHCLTPSRQSGSPHRRYRDGSGSALMCRGSGRGATSASRPQLPSLWRGQSSARAARRRNRRARYPQEADCGLRARRCALPADNRQMQCLVRLGCCKSANTVVASRSVQAQCSDQECAAQPSPSASSAAFPPAAAVLTDSVRSTAKRGR